MEQMDQYPSDALDALAQALCRAQAELLPAEESGRNVHLRTRYATLADVWAACRAALTKHGLSVVQCPMPDEEGWCSLQTYLLHTSGQRISSIIRIPIQKADPQSYGSSLAYCRRYALAAMVGVTSGLEAEDDDAERAMERTLERQPDRQDSAGDRAATSSAAIHTGDSPRPIAAEMCASCNAPAGKPHTRACAVAAGKR